MLGPLKILTLNCQKGYQIEELETFLKKILRAGRYDFLLLQEVMPNVAEIILDSGTEYSLMQKENEAVKSTSLLAIVYRKEFELKNSQFFPFTQFTTKHLRTYGLLLGRFSIRGEELVLGSLHLNSSFSRLVRAREVEYVKEVIIQYNLEKLPVIFGGDFNSALPGEVSRHAKILSPEFVDGTKSAGSTCNTYYVEPTTWLNKLARFLATCGIVFLFKNDHIYYSKDFVSYSCTVLPDRVSDHSPVELLLNTP